MEDDPIVPQEQPKTPVAVCPYCGMDPAGVQMNTFQAGNVIAMAVFCANDQCRKLLPVNILHIEQPRVQHAPPFDNLHMRRN